MAEGTRMYTVPVLLREMGPDGPSGEYLEVIYLVEAEYPEEAVNLAKLMAAEGYSTNTPRAGARESWQLWMVAPPAVIFGKTEPGAELNYRFYEPSDFDLWWSTNRVWSSDDPIWN